MKKVNKRNVYDIDRLCSEITQHSYEKHKNDFSDKNLGKHIKIGNERDFEKHVKETLENRETLCFEVADGLGKGTKFFYNEQNNTMIVVPGLERLESGKECQPTLYRPEKGKKHFLKKN